MVLEHVLEYARQFKIIYTPTRELLLAPSNECGKRKFICSTIRPTKMPFTELYNYSECAKFVADYLEYEELEYPDRLPDTIPSPANVLDWQSGDSFDFAVVLCSMLVGTGYNAYVVYGTAPKSITTKDESLMDCPFDTGYEDEMENEDPHVDKDEEHLQIKKHVDPSPINNFSVETREARRSDFDVEKNIEDARRMQEEALKAMTIDDDEPDYEPEDEFGQSRIHAWVMILKGDREMPKSIFIEPTTGRVYELDGSPYHSIEAIFNHQNFWVNLDPSRQID